jgi:glycosyltransferase involved in cell wall biosynthesis
MHPRPAIAWVEEWMSWRAFNVLPHLAERFDITYVTTGDEIPPAAFKEIRRFPKKRHMMVGGFTLSRCVDQLYRAGMIQLAVVYASIGFAIRQTPYVAIEGGSVYKQIQLLSSLAPWYKRPRFLVGFLHYAVPEMLSVRRARHVVANSEALRRNLINIHHLRAANTEVIHNGIGQDFLALNGSRSVAQRPRLLYVGRLHPLKGIAAVLTAFSQRREIDADFYVLGTGPDAGLMASLAAQDGRIRILGEVDRDAVKQALRTSHIFVFPTYHEGFPSSLLEAMAAGLACVAYDIPVTRETLADAGTLVPLGNTSALLDSVVGLLSHPSTVAAFGARAHTRVRQFSWKDCAVALERTIHAALAELPDAPDGPLTITHQTR